MGRHASRASSACRRLSAAIIAAALFLAVAAWADPADPDKDKIPASLPPEYAKELAKDPNPQPIRDAAKFLDSANDTTHPGDFMSALNLMRQSRSRAAVPLLLGYMSRPQHVKYTGEFLDALTILTGQDLSAYLTTPDGKVAPKDMGDKLMKDWWRPNAAKITTRLADMDDKQLKLVIDRIRGLIRLPVPISTKSGIAHCVGTPIRHLLDDARYPILCGYHQDVHENMLPILLKIAAEGDHVHHWKSPINRDEFVRATLASKARAKAEGRPMPEPASQPARDIGAPCDGRPAGRIGCASTGGPATRPADIDLPPDAWEKIVSVEAQPEAPKPAASRPAAATRPALAQTTKPAEADDREAKGLWPFEIVPLLATLRADQKAESLDKVLKDDKQPARVRILCWLAMRVAGEDPPLEPLAAILGGKDDAMTRSAAAYALGNTAADKHAAIKLLGLAVKDKDADVRMSAVSALGEMDVYKYPEIKALTVRELEQAKGDADDAVAKNAKDWLSRLGRLK